MKHALVLTNNTGLTKMKLVNGIEPTNNDKKINKTPSLRTWPRNNGYEATPMGVCQIKMWIQNQFPTHWPSVGPSRHLGVSEKCVGTGNFQSLSRWAAQKSDEKRFQLTSKNGTWDLNQPWWTPYVRPTRLRRLGFLGMPLQAPGHGEPWNLALEKGLATCGNLRPWTKEAEAKSIVSVEIGIRNLKKENLPHPSPLLVIQWSSGHRAPSTHQASDARPTFWAKPSVPSSQAQRHMPALIDWQTCGKWRVFMLSTQLRWFTIMWICVYIYTFIFI